MSLVWIEADTPLPDPDQALPGGLVAAGLDLSPARLQEAYAKGLFPWFNPGDPVLWWSPDPRMLLFGDALHVSRSLNKRTRQFNRPALGEAPLCVTLNMAFEAVIVRCARRGTSHLGLGAARRGGTPVQGAPGTGRDGTWITPDLMAAYTQWHRMGCVHSVETWVEGQLVGGLYGVSLGRCFFGESMFSHMADASKIALVYLVRFLLARGVPWIDCQQETPHLARMGAVPIPRRRFLALLAEHRSQPAPAWGHGRLMADGSLEPYPAQPA